MQNSKRWRPNQAFEWCQGDTYGSTDQSSRFSSRFAHFLGGRLRQVLVSHSRRFPTWFQSGRNAASSLIVDMKLSP
jgi:hypothetical protein